MDNHHSEEELFSVFLDRNQLAKFEQWCEQNQVSSQTVISKIINGCITNQPIVTEFLLNQSSSDNNLEQKIQLLINQSLAPLIDKIKILERQIEQNSSLATEKLDKTQVSNTTTPTKPIQSEEYSLVEITDKQKIVYLTRHQTWQRLKKTDYIKSAGYDTFLKAKGDELSKYNIFFDSEKKRFYIIEDKTDNNEQ